MAIPAFLRTHAFPIGTHCGPLRIVAGGIRGRYERSLRLRLTLDRFDVIAPLATENKQRRQSAELRNGAGKRHRLAAMWTGR